MKIFIVGSKSVFEKVAEIKQTLEAAGHIVFPPAGYDTPNKEAEVKQQSMEAFLEFKSRMFREQLERIPMVDAVLVLNFEKNGQQNYIGGSTFLEMFKAWELGKKIFTFNPLPENMLHDELLGMNPTVLNGDLSLVKL